MNKFRYIVLSAFIIAASSACNKNITIPPGTFANFSDKVKDRANNSKATASPTPSPSPSPSLVPKVDEALSFSLLNSFYFKWTKDAHRMRRIGARTDGYIQMLKKGLYSGNAELNMADESWSKSKLSDEKIEYSFSSSVVRDAKLKVYHGVVNFDLLGAEKTGDKNDLIPQKETVVDLFAKDIGFEDVTNPVVIMRGFYVDTKKTHDEGYSVRALGFRVSDLAFDKNKISFKAWAEVRAGSTINLNQNLGHYGSNVSIYYSIIGGKDFKATNSSKNYTMDLKAGINPKHEHIAADKQKLSIKGGSGYPQAAVALQGFYMNLNKDANTLSGRFIKEIGVVSGLESYGDDGSADLFVDGFFSNSNGITSKTTNDFTAWLSLLQFKGDTKVKIISESDAMGIGDKKINLTIKD